MCIDQVTFQQVDVTIPVHGLETTILSWMSLEGQPKQYQKAAGRLIQHWLLMCLLGCSRRSWSTGGSHSRIRKPVLALCKASEAAVLLPKDSSMIAFPDMAPFFFVLLSGDQLRFCSATSQESQGPVDSSRCRSVASLGVEALYCQAALLEAEQGNEPVDGGLLGMAAAQARVSHCPCQLLNFPV